MCRLFGFKSVLNSGVHSSLVQADNAIGSQSKRHPDGWGVAFYKEGIPHLIKSVDRAMDDNIFHRVSGVVSSQTVLAHIRKATQGKKTILNSHPFQYGHWVFAHNGNLKAFDHYKDKLLAKIDSELRPFILGNTDSEVLFYLLLTFIKDKHALSNPSIILSDLKEAIHEWSTFVTNLSGKLTCEDQADPSENFLTMMITTGKVMAALNGGQPLFYSTHKIKCADRDICSFFNQTCENETKHGDKVNHLIVSSEILQGENVWKSMQPGELIAVDTDMNFLKLKTQLDFF